MRKALLRALISWCLKIGAQKDYEMKIHTWHSRLLSVLFFPDTPYLAAKWWHRLTLVIFWIWLILAAAGAIHALWDIWEGFSYTPDPQFGDNSFIYTYDEAYREVGECVAYLLSMFVPVVVYRVLLFVGVGNAWKGQPARSNARLEESQDS